MDTIHNKDKSNYVLSASILVAAILVSVALVYSRGLGVTEQKAEVGAVLTGDAFEIKKDDLVFGSDGAPVTIILYSDPSCPFCAAADGNNKEVVDYLKSNSPSWTAPIPGIMENYVNTGKAKLVYRYYPGHGTGEIAMNILYCAYDQGKFWELNKLIGSNQDLVSNEASIKNFAKTAGLDVAAIEACLESGKYAGKLSSDTALGSAANINGTPAFFINGKLISGAQSFSEFKKVIDIFLNNQ